MAALPPKMEIKEPEILHLVASMPFKIPNWTIQHSQNLLSQDPMSLKSEINQYSSQLIQQAANSKNAVDIDGNPLIFIPPFQELTGSKLDISRGNPQTESSHNTLESEDDLMSEPDENHSASSFEDSHLFPGYDFNEEPESFFPFNPQNPHIMSKSLHNLKDANSASFLNPLASLTDQELAAYEAHVFEKYFKDGTLTTFKGKEELIKDKQAKEIRREIEIVDRKLKKMETEVRTGHEDLREVQVRLL